MLLAQLACPAPEVALAFLFLAAFFGLALFAFSLFLFPRAFTGFVPSFEQALFLLFFYAVLVKLEKACESSMQSQKAQ